MHSLLHSATAQQSAIVEDILTLVEVETHSYDPAALTEGLEHVRALAIRLLGEPQNLELEEHGTLQMTYNGTTSGNILIVGHYDTVWPTGTLASWPKAEGQDDSGRATLTGPGIFDMKTGLVQGIWSLKLLKDAGLDHPTITFLFNPDEEIGSPSSRPVIEQAAQKADAVLVLEATADGAVKTGRKGVGIVKASATGIEAHAGLNPTVGASAIHALAEIVTGAAGLADLDRGTSVNVGLISGGTGSNVAAGHATATIDIRVESEAEMARIDEGFAGLQPSDSRVSISFDRDWNRPPMELNDGNKRLLTLVRSAAAELGHELANVSVGGASDANYVSAMGIPVMCGMGAVGDGAHARNEFIYPDQIPLMTALTALSIHRLAATLDSSL